MHVDSEHPPKSQKCFEGQKVLKVRTVMYHSNNTRNNVSECQSVILSFRCSVPTFLSINTVYKYAYLLISVNLPIASIALWLVHIILSGVIR